MIGLIIRIGLIVVAVFLAIQYIPGIELQVAEGSNIYYTFLPIGIAFAIFEILLFPIIKLVTFPIRLITLGLSSFVIYILFIYLVSYIFPTFVIDSIIEAVILTFVLSVLKFIK